MKTKVSQVAQNIQPEQDYFFKCPECGTENDLVTYDDRIVVLSVKVVDGEIQYDIQQESRSYENNPYSCGDCDYVLPVSSEGELLEWLKNHSVEQQESESLE